MRRDVFLLAIAFFCSCIVYSNGCSCRPSHPQDHYCSSDFVILARVKHERTLNYNRFYKVRVRKEYKVSEKALIALKSGRLITAKDDSMCGVQLEVGKLYVISGRVISLKAHVNMCGMAEKWENLSRRQRKGFKLMYRHGCQCQIRNCKGMRCYRKADTCNWSNECETKEGICLKQANKSCMWNRNRALSTCLKLSRTNNTNIEHKHNSYKTVLNNI